MRKQTGIEPVANPDARAGSVASIRHAASARDFDCARALFNEYVKWLDVDICFQGFDEELATMPGAYAPPHGRLLLAGPPHDAFGCIALRPLDATEAPSRGEVKRLYVQPAQRGQGWAKRLAVMLLAEARAIGYRELKLDTLARLKEARALYASLGFRECPPYYVNPLPDVVYMALSL